MNDENTSDRIRRESQAFYDQEVQPKLDDVNRRFDAEMERLDRRATAEANRWSGRQWLAVGLGILLLLVIAFFIGRAVAATLYVVQPIGEVEGECPDDLTQVAREQGLVAGSNPVVLCTDAGTADTEDNVE